MHATWATVGLLFASSRADVERFLPSRKPVYDDQSTDPYRIPMGRSEEDDPFHFAPSLIAQIAAVPGQEIGSHSFSHYSTLRPGQTVAHFEDDLGSAVAIAAWSGYKLESFVFPRNEVNPSYLPALSKYRFEVYRETENTGIKRSAPFPIQRRLHKRVGRFLDSYVNLCGNEIADWPSNSLTPIPVPIPASRYLRPCCTQLRSIHPFLLERIRNQMKRACEAGGIFHLWWHPEDFASHPQENLSALQAVLVAFQEMKTRYGMVSLSMRETLEYIRPHGVELVLAAS